MIEILRIESCACIVNKQTLVLSNHGTWNKFFLLHNSDYTLDLDSGENSSFPSHLSALGHFDAMHRPKCKCLPCIVTNAITRAAANHFSPRYHFLLFLGFFFLPLFQQLRKVYTLLTFLHRGK